MAKKLKTLIAGVMLTFGLVATPTVLADVSYADNVDQVCKGINSIDNSRGGGTDCNGGNQLSKFIKDIINILLFITGAVAVIMIIVGGIRYVTSGGDAGQTKGARDTVLYAVVGVILAVMAFAIVNFVVGAF